MRNVWSFLAACAAVLVVTAAKAQTSGDIAAISQVIREQYFDAARAQTIADELAKRARTDGLDALADRDELARKLTVILKSFDRHFNVRYEPGGPATAGPGPERMQRYEDEVRNANYGFKRVEKLPDDVVLIEVTHVADIDFSNPNDPARRAADAALASIHGARAVIIDVRGNRGGAPSMVGYLVSAFVKPGANVYNTFHARTETQSERPEIEYPHPDLDTRLFVLTNNRTGSAAESIAFSLQSCGRAQVIGERSGGAANPGRFFRTPQGYSVFVSTGSPRNPINGRNWEGTGVMPDVETTSDAALEKALNLARTR